MREKSLQLIRLTKEFLQLKKQEEDSFVVVSYIRNARISDSLGKSLDDLYRKMPGNILQLIKDSGGLEEAQNAALTHAKELQSRMAVLSPEIRKLTDQIEPFVSDLLPSSPPKKEELQPPKAKVEEKKTTTTDTKQVPAAAS